MIIVGNIYSSGCSLPTLIQDMYGVAVGQRGATCKISFGTQYESNFVCRTKALSKICLSEQVFHESCASSQAFHLNTQPVQTSNSGKNKKHHRSVGPDISWEGGDSKTNNLPGFCQDTVDTYIRNWCGN